MHLNPYEQANIDRISETQVYCDVTSLKHSDGS